MRIKRKVCVGGICVFVAIVNLFLVGGDALGQAPLTIDNPDLSMSFNASQVLSPLGGCPPYNWSLSGGGTLTPNQNGTATYVAPASNNNCANNAMITLTDQCRNIMDIQIAVTNKATYTALVICRFVSCSESGQTGLIETVGWNCANIESGYGCNGYPGGGECDPFPALGPPQGYCFSCYGSTGWEKGFLCSQCCWNYGGWQ